VRGRQQKYREFIEYYRDMILSGKMKPGEKMPTVRELMKIHNVSYSTVSRGLLELEKDGLIKREHGRGIFVSEKFRKVTKAAVFLPFGPKHDRLVSEVLKGIEETLNAHSYLPFVFAMDSEHDKRFQVFEEVSSEVRGVLFMPPEKMFENTEDFLEMISYLRSLHRKFPLVIVDRFPFGTEDYFNWVTSDHYEGMRKITELAVSKGYVNLYFIYHARYDRMSSTAEKKKGFIDASAGKNSTIITEKEFLESPLKYFKYSRRKKTAFIANDDALAERIILRLEEEGIPPFTDYGIAGFGNFAVRYSGRLTTVEQFPYQIGKSAAEGLISLIKGKKAEFRKKIPVKVEDKGSL